MFEFAHSDILLNEGNFSLVYLFNGISTSSGLFNPKSWFICICLIRIITIYNLKIPQQYSFLNWTFLFVCNNRLFAYSYVVSIIPIQN